jgi:Na+/H+ antiporter NhaA
VAGVSPAELFIAMLAFDGAPPMNGAKLGTFAGSLLGGIIAAIILKAAGRKGNPWSS